LKDLTLELEIDPVDPGTRAGLIVDVDSEALSRCGVAVHIEKSEDGHGFGVSEIITIGVAVASGVASDLVASAITEATNGVIRRVRSRRGRSDGSVEGIAGLVDDERRREPDTPPDEVSKQ